MPDTPMNAIDQNLSQITLDTPTPKDDEVLIQVSTIGMNRADYLQTLGQYPAPAGASPILGLEACGTITAVGKTASSRWKIGDRVAALMGGGAYAQYAVAHMDLCLSVPAHITDEQAASSPEALFTLWNNLFDRAKLQRGQNVLIHGGTSGIGTFAIQAASAWGAIVYTTTSSREKVEFCEHLGANMAINRHDHDYTQVLKNIPIHAVLSMGGGDDIARDQRLMTLDAHHVSIAFMSSKTATIDIPTMMKNRHVFTGSTLRGRPISEQSKIAKNVRDHLWPMLITGQIDPVIDRVFPLTQAAAAMDYFKSNQHKGKVILKNH